MSTYNYFQQIDDTQLIDSIAQWKRDAPQGGCFALVAEADKAEISTLQARFNECGYPLVGAMFPELIVEGNFAPNGVLLLWVTQFPYCQLLANVPVHDEEMEAFFQPLITSMTNRLENLQEQSALFLVFDGMLPNIATVLERLYMSMNNRVHYFGVNAGSETFAPMPCLFDNNDFIGNGMLAMLLPAHPGAALSHNYREPQTQLMATSSEGNRISSIDWQPAFEVYQQLVKKQFSVEINRENFYEYSVHFPFGISRMDGEPLVRIPVALQEDGSIFCVGEIPPNTLLTLLDGVPAGSGETVDAIVSTPHMQQGELALTFYCGGRRMHLKENANQELQALAAALNPKPVTGAVSLGEIGSSSAGGYPLFHNATLVAAPWGGF